MKWSDKDIDKGKLEITTVIGCSNMCEYCPQKLLIKRYRKSKETEAAPKKMMTLENFKKYISTIPTHINLHFTGYVEPFDNPITHELLLWAHEKGHTLQINTTLEGLTPATFDKIKHISVYKLFNTSAVRNL